MTYASLDFCGHIARNVELLGQRRLSGFTSRDCTMSRKPNLRIFTFGAVLLGFPTILAAQVDGVDAGGVLGLLEPSRTVILASGENGVLVQVPVVEGQRVRAGDPIALLDSDVQANQVEIARQRMQSEGDLQIARAEWTLRQSRFEKLLRLHKEGHVRREEVERAKLDLDVARARVVSQEEELAVRMLEFKRAERLLARRTITSPIDGVVSRLDRREGEFVSPVRPEIAQVIQTDPLCAVFPAPIEEVEALTVGSSQSVTLGRGVSLTGTVESVGVTIDSASQTVKVKISLPNPGGQLRVGEPCKLDGLRSGAQAPRGLGNSAQTPRGLGNSTRPIGGAFSAP